MPGCTNGPNALCDSNIWVGVGASGGQAALRESAGLPPVQLMLLSGPELTTVRLDMAAPLGGMGPFACTQVRPECSVETGGPSPFGGWEAELPRGNPTCASSGSVSGRRVPGSCQAAAESTMGYGVGGTPVVVRRAGGAPAGPECDGRCPECTSLEAVANTGLVPRQCWVRSTPAGGDICAADTLGKVQAIQQTLESIIQASTNTGSCGDLSDPDATCGGCEPLAGTASESCVRCTTAGGTTSTCSYFTRHHNPFAAGGYAAVTSTGPSQDSSAAPRIGSDGSPRLTVEPYSPAFLPCTVGCEKPRTSPRLPSGAPRPGGVARGAADSPPDLAGATPQVNPGGSAAADPGMQTAVSAEKKTDGDPVSLLSGALLLSSTDLSFPGPRRGLSFTRFYDSKTNTRGVLGSNWSHSYEVRVIPLRQENLPSWVDPYCAGTPSIITCAMVVSGEVNRLYILDQVTGLFLPQAGSMATLRKLDDSEIPDAGSLPHGEEVGWALRQPDGQVQFFDRLGYLVRDQDRFGNGLSFVHEKTAAGILAEAVCPLMPYLMSNGLWTAQVGPSGVPSNHVGCALLYGLTGFADLPQFSAGTAVTVEMFPLATTDATVTAARTKVLDSQAAGYGSPLPTGPAHKRLKRVTDDLGRSLEFVYASAGLDEGLLTQVTGPAGAAVAFRYAHPSQPAGLNEAYLIETERLDGPTGSAELVAAPGRGYSYEYAWQRPGEQMPVDLPDAGAARGAGAAVPDGGDATGGPLRRLRQGHAAAAASAGLAELPGPGRAAAAAGHWRGANQPRGADRAQALRHPPAAGAAHAPAGVQAAG